ncbi:hypothetical protein Taro_054061 [Colocasia esculenta]|uniref:Uncharacterized protein n=1 Tax=Colocasia esculenta TaxID=4460 RepID=A0A843XMW9_COLES|nr:hypothetical protein [Colocasia esculenta]
MGSFTKKLEAAGDLGCALRPASWRLPCRWRTRSCCEGGDGRRRLGAWCYCAKQLRQEDGRPDRVCVGLLKLGCQRWLARAAGPGGRAMAPGVEAVEAPAELAIRGDPGFGMALPDVASRGRADAEVLLIWRCAWPAEVAKTRWRHAEELERRRPSIYKRTPRDGWFLLPSEDNWKRAASIPGLVGSVVVVELLEIEGFQYLKESRRRAALSQRSDVVFNATLDLLPRSWIWVPEHRRYSHPLQFIPTPSSKELGITFRTGIGIAYVTTIRNRHFKPVDKALLSQNSILGPKFPPERVSDSLDYANRWRSPHAEPPSHSDWKSCSTQCEISSPEVLDAAFCLRPYNIRLPRLCESLAEPTRGAAQSHRSEVLFNTTRDLLLRSWIWVPDHRRYSHPLRFIPTPSAKELCITFHTGIRIAYVITIRNRHSETVDKALVSRNSVPGPKFPPECVY